MERKRENRQGLRGEQRMKGQDARDLREIEQVSETGLMSIGVERKEEIGQQLMSKWPTRFSNVIFCHDKEIR